MVFICVLILSFLVSYLLFSAHRAIAPQPAARQSDMTVNEPSLTQRIVLSGLDHPWDVAFMPNRTMLFTERSGTVSVLVNGQKKALFKPSDVAPRGEGGMLGLAVDPEFITNHYIYTCYNTQNDIRVVRWQLRPDGYALGKRDKDIVTGIPTNSSGRHSGCRLGFGSDSNLWIGAGDAANENNPQNLNSLGGKVLRVNREGVAAADNNAPARADKRIYSWGHRNIQGIAFYDKLTNGSYGISVEHGSDRDDEVNALVRGNFGWAPGRGYDESVDMTDLQRFPDAVTSTWSSGNPTIATSGAAFIHGSQWKAWQGRLAVGVLKDQHLMLMDVKDGALVGTPQKLLDKAYGRLRAVRLGPDNALYVTTDNGGDDKIVRLIASDQ